MLNQLRTQLREMREHPGFAVADEKAGLPDRVRLFAGAAKREVDEEKRLIDFIVSTTVLDRYNTRIIPPHDYSGYRANPIVGWSHNYWLPPVARCRRIGSDKLKRTLARDEFMPRELWDFADDIFQMYLGGWLNAVSIGGIPGRTEYVEPESETERGYWELSKMDVLEHSCVLVPGNPEAVKETAALRSAVERGKISERAFELMVVRNKALRDGGIPGLDLPKLRERSLDWVHADKLEVVDVWAYDENEQCHLCGSRDAGSHDFECPEAVTDREGTRKTQGVQVAAPAATPAAADVRKKGDDMDDEHEPDMPMAVKRLKSAMRRQMRQMDGSEEVTDESQTKMLGDMQKCHEALTGEMMERAAAVPLPTRTVATSERELKLARNVLDGLREIARNLGVFFDDDGESVPFDAIVEASRRVGSGALSADDVKLRRVIVAAGFDPASGPVLLDDVLARIAGDTARGLAKRDVTALEEARTSIVAASERLAEVLDRGAKKEPEEDAERGAAAPLEPATPAIDRSVLADVADDLLMTLTGRAGRELIARRRQTTEPAPSIVDEASRLSETIARHRRRA